MFCGIALSTSVMSVCPCSWISCWVTTAVGLVADTLAGTGMREPVTMTSWSAGCWSAVVAVVLVAVCAIAVVAAPAMHTHANNNIVHRRASDLKPVGFGIIILSLPRSELHAAACFKVPGLPLRYVDMNTNDRRSDWADDSRASTD